MLNLQPEKVFEYFEMIASVPHGSGNTEQLSDLLCRFAEDRGLAYCCDAVGNMVISKPASAGYEAHEPVILQGHMDMVAVKAPSCRTDLEKDGLQLCTDGKMLWADGTSLGADDGIALAMTLAVLDDDTIPHPPLQALFTVDEETGMDGAAGLNTALLQGKRLINLDSEEEGTLIVGCAGGAKLRGIFKVKRSKDYVHAARIAVYGLTGGHSGAEIHHGRANSNILLGRLLQHLDDVRLISVKGGEKDNAIANKTICEIAISNFDAVKRIVESFEAEVKAEYAETDPELSIKIVDEGVKNGGAADLKSGLRIIKALAALPNGVQSMSADIPGLVQTSLNLGVFNLADYKAEMVFCLRSSDKAELQALVQAVSELITANGGTVELSGEYPAWEYKRDSALRSTAVEAFEAVYGKAPEVCIIHAGLECGLLSDKIPGLDCISFGPELTDVHTVNEKLNIESTQKAFEFLKELLKRL